MSLLSLLPSLGHGIKLIKDHITKGAWAEATAVAWLLARGYVVAKNVSGWGFFDLIAVRTQGRSSPLIELIDVKSFNRNSRNYGPLLPEQKFAGVRVLVVHDDGHVEFIEKGKERVRERIKDNI